MGAQAIRLKLPHGHTSCACALPLVAVLPKATKSARAKAGAKPMTQTALVAALAEPHGLKKKACSILGCSLAGIASQQVKQFGKFTLPGLCRIKTRRKPATKAGERQVFGKTVM